MMRTNTKWSVAYEDYPQCTEGIPLAYNGMHPAESFLGIDDAGAITGLLGCPVNPNYCEGFSDEDLCSDLCFWKV